MFRKIFHPKKAAKSAAKAKGNDGNHLQNSIKRERIPEKKNEELTSKEEAKKKEKIPDKKNEEPTSKDKVIVPLDTTAKDKKETQTLPKDEENIINGGGDDDSSDDDDPDAKLKSIHNLKNGSDRRESLDRYNEMASYTNRSERSHVVPDVTPSKEELEKRKVRIDEEVTIVQNTAEEFTQSEKESYYMQEADFRRCDVDVELTTFRWEKARKGNQKFDDKENTLRGLEDVLGGDPRREGLRARHVQDVLTETMKQRAIGKEYLDWEKIRLAGERTSKISIQTSLQVGEQDTEDAKGRGKSSSQRFKDLEKKNKSEGDGRKDMGTLRRLFSFKQRK
eukprot:CAMPEP_0198140436 /NCGR_PEP_ID=MMETSP1443-20131203/3584_1 /TAXON_ID=186043 /ORGANISM="Entomoneis sp., Strain CCMP2396" /LENGTH=335 /DNA_ID=CAMNT_0043802843 /DNA_START=361 /DNA_END=1368 /DNA_ORIENTATION=+